MLHKLHRSSAMIIGLFVLLHLVNHAAAFAGVQMHMEVMERLRGAYRHPLAETLLLICVLFQIGSGLFFVVRRWGQRQGFFELAQAASGAYLAFFLLVHVSAVLGGRYLLGLDTNFWFAAAGLNLLPYAFFFVPYYFLAVVAFFTHVACALHWLTRERFSRLLRDRAAYAVMGSAVLFSALLVTAFSGGFFPLEIPAEYLATYQ